MTKNASISPVQYAHLTTLDGSQRSLSRVLNYIGSYACVHSAPSAWYGIVVDASIDAGVISVDLADAGLWTQGMTKDLIRPGRKATEDLQARRDGMVTVTAVTAIQPAAFFTEDNDKIKDAPVPRFARAVPPSVEGTSIEDFAKFMETTPSEAANALMTTYWKTRKEGGGKKGEADDLRGNFGAVINYCRAYAETKNFPIRGTCAIVLAGARLYQW